MFYNEEQKRKLRLLKQTQQRLQRELDELKRRLAIAEEQGTISCSVEQRIKAIESQLRFNEIEQRKLKRTII